MPRAMMMSVVCAASQGHVPGLCGHLDPCWCPWSIPQPEVLCGHLWSVFLLVAKLMSMFCAAAERHVDLCGLCCYLRPCWDTWFMLGHMVALMFSAHVTTEGHGDVYGLCSHLSLPRSMVHVHGACYRQKPWGCPWLMLPLTKEQGIFFCTDIDDCRLRVENKRHRKSLIQSFSSYPQKETV